MEDKEISFETSLLAKDIGFWKNSGHMYGETGNRFSSPGSGWDSNTCNPICTLKYLRDWLETSYGVRIVILPTTIGRFNYFSKVRVTGWATTVSVVDTYSETKEGALEKGLQEACALIQKENLPRLRGIEEFFVSKGGMVNVQLKLRSDAPREEVLRVLKDSMETRSDLVEGAFVNKIYFKGRDPNTLITEMKSKVKETLDNLDWES